MKKFSISMLAATLIAAVALPCAVQAQISYATPGSSYTQNFDSLANTLTGITWANNTTLAGWFLFRRTDAANELPPVAIAAYDAGTGSSTTGSFYSFGAAAVAERALGGLGSGGAYFGSPAAGAVGGWMAVGFTNNTGAALNEFTVRYDGEQWRNANTTAQVMVQEFGYGLNFAAVGAWTPTGFNFTSPLNANAGAVNGNGAGLIAGIGGTVAGQNWLNGDTLFIRWIERNDTGNDQGLAADNFSFSANVTSIPEPATFTLIGLGAAGVGYWRWRKRRQDLHAAAQFAAHEENEIG